MRQNVTFGLQSLVLLLGTASLRAELPLYSISKISEIYPTLNIPFENAGGLTATGAVVSGNSLPGQAFAVTGTGGFPRTDIPVIPGAVGYGDTGGNRIRNDIGQFVASAYDNAFETNSTTHIPHLYTPGQGWQSLGRPAENGNPVNAIVTTLNSAGQVLAAGLNSQNDETTAWRYSTGLGWESLGNLGHSSGYARGTAINSIGLVVGSSLDVAGNQVPFIYTDGAGMEAITDSGTPVFGEATAINNNGLVTGTANGRAYVFNTATLEFNYLTPSASQQAVDINSAGAIIGYYEFGPILGIPGNTAWIATEEDGWTNLTSLIEGNLISGEWSVNEVSDINDDGWILANAYNYLDSTSYQVLLRPVPEPSAGLLAGLGVLWQISRRKRAVKI